MRGILGRFIVVRLLHDGQAVGCHRLARRLRIGSEQRQRLRGQFRRKGRAVVGQRKAIGLRRAAYQRQAQRERQDTPEQFFHGNPLFLF